MSTTPYASLSLILFSVFSHYFAFFPLSDWLNWLIAVVIMVLSCRKCSWRANCICNHFLTALDKDFHSPTCNCCGKECTTEDRCSVCYDWDNIKWQQLSEYCLEFAAQREKKEEESENLFLFLWLLSFYACSIDLFVVIVWSCSCFHSWTFSWLLQGYVCGFLWLCQQAYLCLLFYQHLLSHPGRGRGSLQVPLPVI